MLAVARPALFTTSELAARPTDWGLGDTIIVAVSDRPAESRLLAAKQPRWLGYFSSATALPNLWWTAETKSPMASLTQLQRIAGFHAPFADTMLEAVAVGQGGGGAVG